MKRRFLFIYCFFIIAFFSCSKEKADFLLFRNYVEKELGSKVVNNALYLILPLESCNSCIEEAKEFLKLKKGNHQINLIIISDTNNDIDLYSLELKKFNIIRDSKGFFYRSLFFENFSPRIIIIEDEKIMKNYPFDLNNKFENMKSDINSFYK